MEKQIELIPLAEIGHGRARITEDSVEIEVGGISGGMKAWLIGGEAVPIGNIVDGKLRRHVDTRRHIGVLVTQSGRQMLIGKFAEEKEEESEEQVEEREKNEPEQEIDPAPFEMAGFDWKRFTQKSFSGISRELRFILSNKNVYDNYRKHRHFWVSDGESSGALALKCDEEETDPLEFLGGVKLRKNGYVIVCIDKKTNKLYIPE